jgi:hypothetical protein
MRVAILQPNYIPWRGYFDFFKQSDVFVVYDDVQYTKNDWRNRNYIKTPDGVQWLTIPIENKERMHTLIKDVKIINNGWQERHLKAIELNYKDAPYFGEMYDIMKESFYEENLVKINQSIITKILDYFGMRCKIYYSSEIGYLDFDPTERLVAICKHFGATEYLTGESAKDYLDSNKFGGIRVLWHRYKEKVYPQLWGEFISRVSIVDLIMNCGTKGFEII